MKELQIASSDIQDGFAQVKLESFRDLLDYEDYLTNTYQYVFRGQKNPNWPLRPKLFRQYPTITNP